MTNRVRSTVVIALCVLPFCMAACSLQKKAPLEMKRKGFITADCYQILVQFEPDEKATGLVDRRDSALLRAKKSDSRAMLLETLTAYCIESRLQKFNINPSKNKLDLAKIRETLVPKLGRFAQKGKLAFVYYDENMSVIMAYRITGKNLSGEIQSIVDSIELDHAK